MEILFDDVAILTKVKELAEQISVDHVYDSRNTLPPVLICILNGSIHFFSDLVRSMKVMKLPMSEIIDTLKMVKEMGAIDVEIEIRE